MRSGWWTGVLLVALCAVVAAARTTQVESGLRSRRRFSSTSTTSVDDSSPATSTRSLENTSTTIKSRRREDTQTDVIRVRTRSRPSSREAESSTFNDTRQFSSPHSERSERFSRVNFNRTRKKPIENKLVAENNVGNIENVRESSTLRSHKRPYYRSSTRTSIRSSSESPITADIYKSTTSQNTKFRSRSRNTTPTIIKEDATQKTIRSRINTRVYDIKTMPEIASSGSSISENTLKMDASTEKTYDQRGSRKLRYKSRLSDTDTNLTLENNTDKEVNKSSQNRNPVPSQEETLNSAVTLNSSTQEATSTTTQSSNTQTSIVKRPVIRRKINFRSPVSLKKPKSDTSEIDEDDNYPESFKALLQAKNAAPQANSSTKESLSVKASQKIYKTHTLPQQSTNTEPAKTHHLRRFYRERNENKTKFISEAAKDISNNTDISNDSLVRKPDSKNRTSYLSRYRKTSTYNPVTATTTVATKDKNNEKSRYRFNRKLKISTTEPSRTRNTSSERNTLMRTSYYNRLRNSRNGSKQTEGSSTVSNVTTASITTSNVEEIPTSTIKPSNIEISTTVKYVENEDQVTHKPIVLISSTELPDRVQINSIQAKYLEKTTSGSLNAYTNNNNDSPLQKNLYIPKLVIGGLLDNNEILNRNEESDPIDEYMYTTSKYHSSYRDVSLPTVNIDDSLSTEEPLIKNLQTRKFVGRKHHSEDNIRKYSESPSRSTTYTNNVTPEPEKSRERFSSRYRSPIERPMYRPTVPTITPSTAWLKFYVTDKQLTKSIQTSDWFPIEEQIDITTPAIGHYIIATSPFIRDPSIKLVEGEEMQLGPDINAISFSKTRSTLTSADLKLSESVLASAQLVNVETSNHSPSVTVSIFDALAEILTSTPKPQLSSTTAVSQKISKNEVTKQSHNGVSNKNNVNNLQDLNSQAKTVPTDNDLTTSTNIVQITDQITPNVINQLSVMDKVTPSLNLNNQHLESTLPNIPTSTRTTPISARKPFAIKVLYSDKDTPTDTLVTASTQNWSRTTDNPSTVLTSVSDIILPTNDIVSSELTNTLSQNIKNILDGMDENTRAKISVDMAKLLKTLVPRALDGVSVNSDNVDVVPDTTPYSLEEIRNTEIKDIEMFSIQNSSEVINNNIDILSSNLSQTIGNNINVNNENSTLKQDLGVISTVSIAVNSSNTSVNNSTSNTTVIPESVTLSTSVVSNGTLLEDKSSIGDITPIAFIENVPLVDPIKSGSVDKSDDSGTRQSGPVPFFTNFQLIEDESNDINMTSSSPSVNLASTLTLPTNIQLSTPTNIELNTQTPVLVPPNQLWLLSKKADILKRIEDIIKVHNFEIATASNPTLNDIVNNSIPINSLSERLTKMVLQLNITNKDVTDKTILDSQTNTLTPPPSTNQPPTNTVSSSIESTTTIRSLEATTETMATDKNLVQSRIDSQASNDTTGAEFVSTDVIETTTVNNIIGETTTDMGTETTTELTFDTTTQGVFDTTTILDPVMTTFQNNETSSPGISDVSENVSPKKDYVIFGILPNNTVVRKDPNDNALESLTEASPYIIYGVLPNNTIIRKFPNGTRVPRVMQKIDVLPISPWSLRNPYSPIHNNPAIVKPRSNLIRVSTNVMTSTDATNNGTENTLTTDPVNNNQITISTTTLNINDSSSLGITTVTNKTPAETSTASHVLSLRTTTMLPSVDEILLNSISSAAKEDMIVSAMTSSTREPRILTLDIDPETQQIRTEKPSDGMGASVFKFIPIDEVMVSNQDSNVLKLASTKAPVTFTTNRVETTIQNTETNTPPTKLTVDSSMLSTTQSITNPPVQTSIPILTTSTEAATTTISSNTNNINLQANIPQSTTTSVDPVVGNTEQTESSLQTTTNNVKNVVIPQGRSLGSTSSNENIINSITTTSEEPKTTFEAVTSQNNNLNQLQEEAKLLQALLLSNTQNAGLTNVPDTIIRDVPLVQPTKLISTSSYEEDVKRFEEDTKLLRALIAATGQNPDNFKLPTLQKNEAPQTPTTTPVTTPTTTTTTTSSPITTTQTSTTSRNIPSSSTPSLEDDIRRFQEDAKLLQALLQATGQSTVNLNIPNIPVINSARSADNTVVTTSTTGSPIMTTSKQILSTTTDKPQTTTSSVSEDLRKLQEDAILLQSLLQATGQNSGNLNLPIISGITSNVRVASNPLTTSIMSDTPTTPQSVVRPVFTSRTQNNALPPSTTTTPNVITTLQPRRPLTLTTSSNEEAGISTTNQPFINQGRRLPTTTVINEAITSRNFRRPTAPTTRRTLVTDFTSTTEIPSTSTFSVEEDLQFLNNLKNVLNTNADPETDLANRIIALAVERSLNEIETNKQPVREGKAISGTPPSVNRIIAQPTTTTTTTTTTIRPPTTTAKTTPSIEDDIKQFEEDTKLLKALLQATGQDPSKFNIPTITNAKTNVRISQTSNSANVNDDLKLLSNLLASPSPLNEPFDSLTQNPRKPNSPINSNSQTTIKPNSAIINNDIKKLQDDPKFLQSLIQLQGKQETTTQRSTLSVSGLTGDEALSKLLKQNNNMVSEATKTPVTVSTEFGKSSDALLAALLKEQGFGPSTASSLDEQLRLAALLNQVVVTPKIRRTTTTTPPPAPAQPRRPIIDGIAWLWQQWRETAPGSPRPSRKPSAPAASSTATSNRVNWFGSGPFVGNAPEPTTSNRIPLEPPRAVVAEQAPGRGQIVSAAINVTRAFSQFLGAAIQGAAQTVQNVIKAGQKAATDVYTSGSG